MKILLLNNEFPPIGGGGSTVTKYAVKYLVELGHKVTLITSSFKNLPKRERVDRAKVIRVRAIRRYKDFCAAWELLTYLFSSFFYCLFFIPRFRPDIIQAYFSVPAGAVAYLLHKIYGIPYVVYFGGSDMPGSNPTRYQKLYPLITYPIKKIWRNAARSIVASKRLREIGNKIDPKYKFDIIPNGVDLSRFHPIKRPENPKVKVLFMGRLIPRKGLQYVVEALPGLARLSEKEFEIEVVGTGEQRRELDSRAKELGVYKYLKYVGLIDYEDLHKAYQSADIFVVPSKSEGMPCALLEAMGCGLPVVASRVSGNEEVVKERVNGFLFEVGDNDKLAESLGRLINDEDLRERMGRASLKIIKPYDWKLLVKKYDKIYQEIVR